MIFITFLLLSYTLNIVQDNLPRLQITINNKPFTDLSAWVDSVATNPESAAIRYKINGAHSNGLYVKTRISLPQVLTLNEVVKQIILYYNMLDDETAREKEEILIFPYFASPEDPPSMRVNYSGPNTIDIQITQWETITRPSAPSPEERDIYNQIIEESFNDIQDYEKISDEVFEKIARENKVPVTEVIKIYKNVILWQISR